MYVFSFASLSYNAENFLRQRLLLIFVIFSVLRLQSALAFQKVAQFQNSRSFLPFDRLKPIGAYSSRNQRDFSSGGDLIDRLNFQKVIKINPSYQIPITELNCSSLTKNTLLKKGFTHLTPIQSQSFEPILAGEDIIGRSRTGTGKTLAFGIPILEQLIMHPIVRKRKEEQGLGWAERGRGKRRLPLVLILEPTRELALQVAQELANVGSGHNLRVTCVYGGASFLRQEEELRAPGCDILVATPGRLLDHIQQQTIDLSRIAHVVLDEGDTMLEMGFQEDVESILQTVDRMRSSSSSEGDNDEGGSDEKEFTENPLDTTTTITTTPSLKKPKSPSSKQSKKKLLQMLLFSATMPSWIVSMTNRLMKEPVFLDAIQEGETRLASTIKHYSILLPDESDRRGRGGKDRVDQVAAFLEDLILTKTMIPSSAATTTGTGTAAAAAGTPRRGQQTIIFTNTKEEADRLASMRCFQYFSAQVLHGDISQYMRQKTLSLFRQQYLDILISTEVAARGLDIQGVDLVIHLAPPRDVDSYVHRSGRTGRAGRNGTSICFYAKSDQGLMSLLQKKLKFSFQSLGLPLPSEVCQACVSIVEKKLGDVEAETVQYFLPHAERLLLREQAKVVNSLNNRNEEAEVEEEVRLEKEETKWLENDVTSRSMVELLSRCMAAISQRSSITARSLLSGKEGFLTIAFEGPFINRNPDVWNKFLMFYLGKTLAIERFQSKFAKLPSLVVFAMNDSKPQLLVDFEDELGQLIVEKAKQLGYPEEVRVSPCTALPDYVQWDSASSSSATSAFSSSGSERRGGGSRDWGRGGGDRDRDRSRGDRGGERFDRRRGSGEGWKRRESSNFGDRDRENRRDYSSSSRSSSSSYSSSYGSGSSSGGERRWPSARSGSSGSLTSSDRRGGGGGSSSESRFSRSSSREV